MTGGAAARRRRLLVICAAFPPMVAPEAAHARELCRRLAEAGADVDLLTSTAGTDRAATDRFAPHPVMRGWGWRDLPRLLRLWWRVRPDAVLLLYVAWLYGDHPMATWLPLASRWMPGRPRFVTQFENVGVPCGRWARLQRRLFRFAPRPWRRRFDPAWGALLSDSDAVIAMCQPHLDALARARPPLARDGWLIPAPPLVEAPPDGGGLARAAGRAALGVADDAFVIASFGYVYRGKGVETLLRALAMLDAGGAPVGRALVVVIGAVTEPDYGAELLALSADLGLADRVRWLGYCDGARASALLRAADACALPFDAGVALNNSSFVAAASHGLPVVTTAGPRVEPAFVGRPGVALVPPADPAAIAGQLARWRDDPGARAAAGADAAALADERFNWAQAVERTLAALVSPFIAPRVTDPDAGPSRNDRCRSRN